MGDNVLCDGYTRNNTTSNRVVAISRMIIRVPMKILVMNNQYSCRGLTGEILNLPNI